MIRHSRLVVPASFCLLVGVSIWSLTLGRYPISLSEVLRVLTSGSPFNAVRSYSDAPWVVIEIIRLPRILLVTLCGMGLALSGAAMQGVFRNPLVGPEVCGVQSGASFGGVLAILLGWSATGTVGLAFGFGLGALAAALFLARIAGRGSILALVLSGVIISGFFGALTGFAQYMADPRSRLPDIVYWLLGSFAGANYEKVRIVGLVTLVAGTVLIGLRWRINLLSLGETDAAALGVRTELLRWSVVALVAVIVAAQVAVSGGVGWVGLVVPHLARMVVGPEHSRLLLASSLLGGLFLLLMDDLARSATAQELPIGILTSMVGAPVFAFLFWKIQAKGWTDG